jgi:hypothetical protein
VVWPGLILSRREPAPPHAVFGTAPRAVDPRPRIIGGQPGTRIVDQIVDRAGDQGLAEGGERGESASAPGSSLDRFEWVDRERELVAIPVDLAIEAWLARNRSGADRGGGR